MCLAALAGLLAELGDLFVGLGVFEPFNIIKSQVEFGVQPVGLRRFCCQCCKNAVGLPVGLAAPPSPTAFFAHFHEPSERPSLGRLRLSLQPCCGQNCHYFPVGPTSPSESNRAFQLSVFSSPQDAPKTNPRGSLGSARWVPGVSEVAQMRCHELCFHMALCCL